MRLTEFWQRMDDHLGAGYAASFAADHVITDLEGMTVEQALASGVETKVVWRAVWATLGLPASAR